jgi:hypothetical protein
VNSGALFWAGSQEQQSGVFQILRAAFQYLKWLKTAELGIARFAPARRIEIELFRHPHAPRFPPP